MAAELATTAAFTAGAMFCMWLLSLALRDASIVDVFWGVGFVLIAGLCLAISPAEHAPRHGWLMACTALWGLRLASYLFWRNHGAGEDPRYQAMRRHWGPRFTWVSLFTVFGLQGVLMWFVSLPLQVALLTPTSPGLGFFDVAGASLYATGLFFETVGDWQLARFKADAANAGRVMDRGLWRYTRHPNYFGDFTVWWGLFLLSLASSPAVLWTLLSPVAMSFLLMKVSGVPMLERSIGKRRPGYADYAQRTSTFFPRPPRGSEAGHPPAG